MRFKIRKRPWTKRRLYKVIFMTIAMVLYFMAYNSFKAGNEFLKTNLVVDFIVLTAGAFLIDFVIMRWVFPKVFKSS